MLYRTLLGIVLVAVLAVAATGCVRDTHDRVARDAAEQDSTRAPARQSADRSEATSFGGTDTLSREALEEGRFDDSWRTYVEADTTSATTPRTATSRTDSVRTDQPGLDVAVDTTENDETWDALTADAVNGDTLHLPLAGEVEGPSVLRVQVLLDRVWFSPGIIDGRWGKNTEKAVYWLQRREGLEPTGTVDRATFDHLMRLAGNPQRWVEPYTVTEEDVAGPFVDIPEDIYEKAELDRLGYESVLEKLAEAFHAAPDLLQKLNPEVAFDSLTVGTEIQVPSLRHPDAADRAPVDRLVISDKAHYVHALDSTGQILYHFPSTLGSSYDPSPSGNFEVTSITEDPWWHYQPDLLAHVDDNEPDAHIPPGPNNAVGVVWIALSEPHYGIHGTSAPETIGYVTSAGCVRLTNWDARFLARRLTAGTPVHFRDTGDAMASSE